MTAGAPVSLPASSQEKIVREYIAAFNKSEFAILLGMQVVDAHDGYARVEMDCAGKLNPDTVAHGGAIFSLADQAFGIAANCTGIHRVAVSVHIQYLAPAKSALVAVANRVEDNGRCDTYRVLVSEGTRIVATFDGVAFRITPGNNTA
jgi:acyl-CoA thioesterase